MLSPQQIPEEIRNPTRDTDMGALSVEGSNTFYDLTVDIILHDILISNERLLHEVNIQSVGFFAHSQSLTRFAGRPISTLFGVAQSGFSSGAKLSVGNGDIES